MPLYVPAFPKVLIISCFGIKLFYAILLWRATDYIQFIFLVAVTLINFNSKNKLWRYPLWNSFPTFCCFILLFSNMLFYKALSCLFLYFIFIYFADIGGRAVWGVVLRPLACWDWRCESRWGLGYLLWVLLLVR